MLQNRRSGSTQNVRNFNTCLHPPEAVVKKLMSAMIICSNAIIVSKQHCNNQYPTHSTMAAERGKKALYKVKSPCYPMADGGVDSPLAKGHLVSMRLVGLYSVECHRGIGHIVLCIIYSCSFCGCAIVECCDVFNSVEMHWPMFLKLHTPNIRKAIIFTQGERYYSQGQGVVEEQYW